jgi:hypothetical protein
VPWVAQREGPSFRLELGAFTFSLDGDARCDLKPARWRYLIIMNRCQPFARRQCAQNLMKTREVNLASAQAPIILPSSARQDAQANNHHAYWSHKDTFPEHLRPIVKKPNCLQWKSSSLAAGGLMMTKPS